MQSYYRSTASDIAMETSSDTSSVDHMSPKKNTELLQRRLVASWVKGSRRLTPVARKSTASITVTTGKSAIVKAPASAYGPALGISAAGVVVASSTPDSLPIERGLMNAPAKDFEAPPGLCPSPGAVPGPPPPQKERPSAACIDFPSELHSKALSTGKINHLSISAGNADGSTVMVQCAPETISNEGELESSDANDMSRVSAVETHPDCVATDCHLGTLDPRAARSPLEENVSVPSGTTTVRDRQSSSAGMTVATIHGAHLSKLPPAGSDVVNGDGGSGEREDGRVGEEKGAFAGGDGAEEVALSEERLASVQCYLRDDDPIFIRTNLNRLLEGTLLQLEKGDTVSVARRCRGTENNEGGPGRVTRVLRNLFYDIKYAVSGVEKGVDGCFVERTVLGTRRRRGSTPRCPDCHSFLFECTCEGFIGLAETAALEPLSSAISGRVLPSESRYLLPSSVRRPVSQSYSLKRPRVAIGRDAMARKTNRQPQQQLQDARSKFKSASGNEDGNLPNETGAQVSQQRNEKIRATVNEIPGSRYGLTGNERDGSSVDVNPAQKQSGGKGGGSDSQGSRDEMCSDFRSKAAGRPISEMELSVSCKAHAPRSTFDCSGPSSVNYEQETASRPGLSNLAHNTHGSQVFDDETSIASEGERPSSKPGNMPDMVMKEQVEHRSESHGGDDGERNGAFASFGSQSLNPQHEKEQVVNFNETLAVTNDDVGTEEQDNGETLWMNTDNVRDRDAEKGSHDSEGPNKVHALSNSSGDRSGVDGVEGYSENARNDGSGAITDRAASGDSDISQSLVWRPSKGDLVEVERRMTPGVNKPGGTARVVKVDSTTGAVDVRYIVVGGWERGIDPMYVTRAVLDLREVKRPTLGRCQHCGSLRIDCQQGCEYYTAPRLRPPPPIPSAYLLSSAIGSDGDARRTDRVNHSVSGGPNAEHNHLSGRGRRRQRRRASGSISGEELQQNKREGRRRRVLGDWDEEGVPMPGSEEDDEAEAELDGYAGERCFDAFRESGQDSVEGSLQRIKQNVGSRWVRRESSGHHEMSSPEGRTQSRSSSSSSSSNRGTLSSDNGNMNEGASFHARGRHRRPRERNDESDTEGERSHPDVELLCFRSATPHPPRTQGSVSSSCSGDRVDYPGLESDHDDAAPSGRNSTGGRNQPGAALFLMPEGEEASRALPDDIQDPTRDIKDPVVLRQELKRLLQEMEDGDAKELERIVPAICGRVERAATAAGRGRHHGNDTSLGADVVGLQSRIEQSLRQFDVPNNIWPRLVKLSRRWRESLESDDTWHRLDRLSRLLEGWRKEAEKAVREYTKVIPSRGGEESNIPYRWDHSSWADYGPPLDPASATNSSEDFRVRRTVVQARWRPNGEGVAIDSRPLQRRSTARSNSPARGRRGSDADRGDASDTGGTLHRSSESSDHRAVSGAGNRSGNQSQRGGKKRSRQESSSERRHRRGGTTGPRKGKGSRGSVGSCGSSSGRRANTVGNSGQDWVSDEEEGGGAYLAGLDYSMTVEPDEDGWHRGRGRSRSRSTSSLSSLTRSMMSPSSSPSASPSPTNAAGHSREGNPPNTLHGISVSASRRRRAQNQSSSSSAAGRRASFDDRSSRAGGSGSDGCGDRGYRRRGKYSRRRHGGDGSTGRVGDGKSWLGFSGSRSNRIATSSSLGVGGIESSCDGGAKRRNGLSAEVMLFRQRLAEQEARGKGLTSPIARDGANRGGGAQDGTGDFDEPADRWQVETNGAHCGCEGLRGAGGLLPWRGPPGLPNLVEDFLVQPPLQGQLRFKTLYSSTVATTEIDLDGRVFSVLDVIPPSSRTLEDSLESVVGRGGEFDGELEQALNVLPQRMADLEELAKVGLEEEAESLARECCKIMAVISAAIRALNVLASESSSSGGLRTQQTRRMRFVAKTHVVRLAEAAAPGSLASHDSRSDDHRSYPCPGLSLGNAVALPDKFRRGFCHSRGTSITTGSRGPAAVASACAAFHIHLLEWLQIADNGDDPVDPDRETDEAHVPRPRCSGCVLDFASRLLLDLLCIYEDQLPTTSHMHASARNMQKDPLAELWCVVMDVLDGTGVALRPPAKITIPGLTRPVVGFWGVLLDTVSGSNISHRGGRTSWKGGLPSELVWRALIHSVRLRVLREGWEADSVADTCKRGSTSADTRPPNNQGRANASQRVPNRSEDDASALTAEKQGRWKEISQALWQCIRLLLAASPFAPEFAAGAKGQVSSAVVATAQATALTRSSRRSCYSAASMDTVDGVIALPVTAVKETFSVPGMVARVLLQRVLVLARVYPPDAGPQGVIEKLWEGVQRLSRLLCVIHSPLSLNAGSTATDGDGHKDGDGMDGAVCRDVACVSPPGDGERERRRLRNATRLTRHSTGSSSFDELGRLLSSASKAWCLPAHQTCRLPRGVLEGVRGAFGAGLDSGGRTVSYVRDEGDHDALCSLTSLLTLEHAMRLPGGLKRRRLANGLLKAKYSSPPNSERPNACGGNVGLDDDDQALAPTRVLLAIALGLARAGLGVAAAQELAKASAVRPRGVSADTPRDKSIALVAPAAAALCIALPLPGSEGANSDGDSGDARMELFGVLSRCMRDAVELMARVIDGALRLGQAINPERLERPRAAIGLAASCILLALRHLGPRAMSSPLFHDGGNGSIDPDGVHAELVDVEATTIAAEAFVEVLSRPLEKRFLEHIGRPALTVILSSLRHCWPSTHASASATAADHVPSAERGYAMGWWNGQTDSPVRTLIESGLANPVVLDISTATLDEAGQQSPQREHEGQRLAEEGNARAGVQSGQQEEEDEMKDEYGSWDDFVDDAGLDALLSGGKQNTTPGDTSQIAQQTQQKEERGHQLAAASATAAKIAAADRKREEQEQLWQSLAKLLRKSVLPHVPEVIKRTWTTARYAQDSQSTSRAVHEVSVRDFDLGSTSRRGGTVGAGGSSNSRTEKESQPQPRSATGVGNVSPRVESHVDATVVLEAHASASLVALRGSIEDITDGRVDFSYYSVLDKYLELHRMAQNPLVPQQRLLAPAFLCVALSSARAADVGDGGKVHSALQDSAVHPNRLLSSSPRTGRALLTEALSGREWEVLQLWVQAALDPMAFPERSQRRIVDNHGLGGRSSRSARHRTGGGSDADPGEPSDLVRERFEEFTQCLAKAFGSGEQASSDGSYGGEADGVRGQRALRDTDGAFEKRLSQFEPAQWAALSKDESRILVRILDVQSVVAHCGSLWAAALVITGPASMREVDRKRTKDRVVKLLHASIKSLKRFLPEVFPRVYDYEATAGNGNAGGTTGGGGMNAFCHRYGSKFRRLYGHAAYSLVAFLVRMCAGALKGPPLRDLVETCFEGIACSPCGGMNGSVAAAGGAASRRRERGEPHPELTALAVMHASDLLQCFSEMPMTVNPVADWIKNMNDHAINGKPTTITTADADAALLAPSSLVCSLAAGLRGDLSYPSPTEAASAYRSSSVRLPPDVARDTKDAFVGLVSAAALGVPPRAASAVLAKQHLLARMRQEMLGDRKLRVARYLLEAAGPATSSESTGGQKFLKGSVQRSVFMAKNAEKTRLLLVLLKEVFRRRRGSQLVTQLMGQDGMDAVGPPDDCGPSVTTVQPAAETQAAEIANSRVHAMASPFSALRSSVMLSIIPSPPPLPSLEVKRDILTFVRPVYSVLGQALLGEPGPARGLGRYAVAAAVALSTAALDASLSANERRIAECFAQVVVLAVATKLDTFLSAMEVGILSANDGDRRMSDRDADVSSGSGGGSGEYDVVELEPPQALGIFAPREVELEHLLREMGAWDVHGGTSGWPHNAPIRPAMRKTKEQELYEGGQEAEDTPLPALIAEADGMTAAFSSSVHLRYSGAGNVDLNQSGRWWQQVEGALLPRIAACRSLLAGDGSRQQVGHSGSVDR